MVSFVFKDGIYLFFLELPIMRSPSIVFKLIKYNLFLSDELKSVLDATDLCHLSRYARKSFSSHCHKTVEITSQNT